MSFLNGNRHNGFGSRMSGSSRSVTKAMSDTRTMLARQGNAAAFDAVPATNQWPCTCGGINPASRSDCRWCGASKQPEG